MNLLTIPYLREAFDAAAGLSDHSLGLLSACTAVALGAKVIEKHFCLGRGTKTPDSDFSMEPKEFSSMVESIRAVEQSLGSVCFEPTPGEAVSMLHRKSIFVTADIRKGDVFTRENIRVIRPAQGIKPMYYDQILGKRSACDIEAGTPLEGKHISESTPI
jgi:pseudaminic acid synthase